MNKQRRKRLSEATELLGAALSIIEEVKAEEEEAFDNLPEGIQCGERGEQMEEYISILDDVYGSIEELDLQITEIIEG